MIKAIFFDIDGTLFSHKTRYVPPTALAALERARAKGIKLFINTGRHSASAEMIRQYYSFDGYCTMNGQHVVVDGQLIHGQTFTRGQLEYVAEVLRGWDLPVWFCEGERMYIHKPHACIVQQCERMGMPLPPTMSLRELPTREIYQINSYLFEDADIRRFGETFPDFNVTQSTPMCHDVTPPGGGKHRAIQAVCEHYGFAQGETMAFGDGQNDASMLEYAGIGVAVAGGYPGIEKHADWLAPEPDEDGILKALEHFEVI